ncbi:MAG: KpsF/GutQ family sugar-phosphate isomerase [Pseudomonadota bacterium]|nr:KpsF/GutQ family sugar-phosphate isomerase [Pseudomonadota bacterium]
MKNNIIESAQEVINIEAAALRILANDLPSDFTSVINLLKSLKGHLIISGIGKSGHIARKISATLSSTGTPSYFVHATEASHGDIGAITSRDACLLISNSGESPELRDLLNHTRRYSIPLLGMSSNPNSSLMLAAEYKLYLPNAKEACSIGLAPTTSTTMALALGDAIAVTLMKERNFQAENFKVLHPGGKLGAQLSTVEQLMHRGTSLPIVQTNTAMGETLLEMTSKGFGAAIVMKNQKIYGVITDGDLRRHMVDLMSKTAGEIASTNPVTIYKTNLAAKALSLMNKHKINVIIAIDHSERPLGILHVHDCLRAGL